MERLILIDGNSILNRAFYGIMGSKMLTTPDGTPTNAVYGFLAIMFKIIDDLKPEYIAVAFDLKAKTKRHLMYEQYKATRKGMPDELAIQMPIIKDVLRAMNITIFEKEGYEADDILGTLAKLGSRENLDVTILTGDRDSFQLAENNITIRIPRTKMGETQVEDFNYDKVIETYGVEPAQLIEVKGLMGDTSDNIPGVKGIGEKTALELIKEYNNIQNLYDTLPENDKIKGKLREKLEADKDNAFLSRELGIIDIEVELNKNIEDLKAQEWNFGEVYNIFKDLKFNRFIDRFNLSGISKKTEIAIEKVEDINSIKESVLKYKRIFFYVDTENAEEDFIINKKIKAIYVYDEDSKKILYISKQHVNQLKDIIEDQDILKIGYKLKENYIIFKEQGLNPKNMMFDIGVSAYILNSTLNNYNITSLIEIYLDMDLKETTSAKQNQDTQMDLFSMQVVSEKAVDTENTNNEEIDGNKGLYTLAIFELYNILNQKLKETEQLELFNTIEMPLLEVLAEMQYTGIYVDKDELNEFGQKLEIRINELTKNIHEAAGEEFNINSPKQLGEILFEKLQLPTQKKTKTGYSTNVEVLEKLEGKHVIISYILEYRQLVKLNSTYVIGLTQYINKKTGRIHSEFHQTVTTTGRISSTDPNLQNIPTRLELGRQLRKAFKAKEGATFVDADYSQIELRILAHIADDKIMKEAFEHDEDIHKQVASNVFNVPMEEVTKEQRSHAKAVNFGIVYGISDFGLSEQLKIPKKEAKQYIEQYLEKYSGIKRFMEDVVEKAKEQGYIETLFNRRRFIPELSSNSYVVRQFGERVAMNTPIQGTAADVMKIAMINIYNELKKRNFKSRIVLQVHDEIMLEAVEDEINDVKEIIIDKMENATELNVRLKAEIEEGKSWYEAK